MARIDIDKRISHDIAGYGSTKKDIDSLKIVCDTVNGKQEVLVYVNGELFFGRDFSRKPIMIKNNIAIYEEE